MTKYYRNNQNKTKLSVYYDICDHVVKEFETLHISRCAGTTMPGNVKVPNEAKVGRQWTRFNKSNDMESDGAANRQADRGSKKKKGKATIKAYNNQLLDGEKQGTAYKQSRKN